MNLLGKRMKMFESFRGENGFTFYPNHESPNSIDKPLVVVTYFCVLLAVATLLASFGVRGKEKWYCVARACYSVAVGSIILACIVSHSWKEGHATVTSSPYVYRADLHFKGEVGLKIGLHSANVTLEGSYRDVNGKRHHVDYVESLDWANFGDERDAYPPMLRRGLPEPILKVMEFLTMRDGGMRWGSTFHSAGQVTCALLWTAFAFWVLTNALLFSVIVYGAYMFFFTGLALIMACIAYHACQNDYPLYMMYGDQVLELSYGWSYWLTLVTGVVTTLLGVVLILADHFLPEAVAEFFHLEKPITEDVPEENSIMAPRAASFNTKGINRQLTPTKLGDSHKQGSIFLEPERRRASMNESLFKKAIAGASMESSPFVNKGFEGDTSGNGTRFNPIYVGDQVFNYTDEERKMAEMERVCERGPFHLKDGKASLATMNELRDNHANERKSTSFINRISQEDPSGLASAQSSPRLSSYTLGSYRPRAGSDATALTRPTHGYINNRQSVESKNSNSTAGSAGSAHDHVDSTTGIDGRSENEASSRDGATGAVRPNQVEVEVETHLSSSSDLGDTQTPRSLSPQDGDCDDRRSSYGSVFSADANPAKGASVSPDDTLPPPPPPSTTCHFETPQITIQIDPC